MHYCTGTCHFWGIFPDTIEDTNIGQFNIVADPDTEYPQSLGYPPPPERTWDQWKYYEMEMGYTPPPPPVVDKVKNENITSRRTTYAGGKN